MTDTNDTTPAETISQDELRILLDMKREFEAAHGALQAVYRSLARRYELDGASRILDDGRIVRAMPAREAAS